MHHRRIDCRGYLRDDGMWDIEGHLVDTKPYDLPNPDRGGTIRAGEHLHEMWIRLTVDTDLLVHEVEAKTDFGPYSVCGDITDNFRALVGLRIAAGWTQKTRELLGGVKGCTHLVELLGPGATTAFQPSTRLAPNARAGRRAKPENRHCSIRVTPTTPMARSCGQMAGVLQPGRSEGSRGQHLGRWPLCALVTGVQRPGPPLRADAGGAGQVGWPAGASEEQATGHGDPRERGEAIVVAWT